MAMKAFVKRAPVAARATSAVCKEQCAWASTCSKRGGNGAAFVPVENFESQWVGFACNPPAPVLMRTWEEHFRCRAVVVFCRIEFDTLLFMGCVRVH